MKHKNTSILSILGLSVGIVLLPCPVVLAQAENGAGSSQSAPAQIPSPAISQMLAMPPWAEVSVANATDNHPLDTGSRRFMPGLGGLPVPARANSGPSAGIQVNLAIGVESYLPSADVTAHNPTGSDVVFQRSFRSDRALSGYGSPGLSPGWVHNYDITIRPLHAGSAWSELSITYPSGEKDYVKPTLDENGAPTGKFQTANSAPMEMEGKPSATANQWETLVIRWRSAAWYFTLFAKDTYVLSQIENLRFEWNASRALMSVFDTTANTKLLALSYTPEGYLASVVENSGIKRTYAFGVPQEANVRTPCLLLVSQVFRNGEAIPDAQWAYGYTSEGANPLLSNISVPSPTGQGISTCGILYEKGMVLAHVDANGNQRRYTYSPNHTLVQVIDGAGKIVTFWTQNYDDKGRNTGITDALGHSTKLEYGGSAGH